MSRDECVLLCIPMSCAVNAKSRGRARLKREKKIHNSLRRVNNNNQALDVYLSVIFHLAIRSGERGRKRELVQRPFNGHPFTDRPG